MLVALCSGESPWDILPSSWEGNPSVPRRPVGVNFLVTLSYWPTHGPLGLVQTPASPEVSEQMKGGRSGQATLGPPLDSGSEPAASLRATLPCP